MVSFLDAIQKQLKEGKWRARPVRRVYLSDVVAVLNPVLCGWGAYFRTGNASKQFQSLDRFVTSRLTRLIGQREGWKRRSFHAKDWPHNRFVHDFNLHKLLGTICYPGGTHAT